MLLILATACAVFWKLGSGSLAAWDEAIYAQVAKEMAQGGDWLTPHWSYQVWFEKPPLLIWVTACFFRLFGVSEFWARAASALSGIGVVLLTYSMGARVYSRRVGLLAAVVLLTGYHFLSFARFGTMEVMLTLFICLAVDAYTRVRAGQEKYWYLVWTACALALLTKGAGGLIAPALIVLAVAFDRQVGEALRSKHFRLGALLCVLLVAPWHLVMYARYGSDFTGEYLGYHVLARTTRTLEGHPTGYLYFVGRLLDGFFPWCLLVPFALVSGLRETLKGERRAGIFLLLFGLVFSVYTLIPTRRPWYIVPLYPALSILIAALIVKLYRAAQGRALYRRLVAAACVVLVIAAASYSVLSLYLNRRGDDSAAQLAWQARRLSPADREPLVAFSEGSEAEPFDAQTLLFYSDRPVEQAYADHLPANDDAKRYVSYSKLSDLIETSPGRIILRQEDVQRLSAKYELQVLAQAGSLVYATIKRKETKGEPQ